MTKEEALIVLQDKARELAEREDILMKCGQARLSELTCVKRMINFKVQEIIRDKPQSEISASFEELESNLIYAVESNRDRRLTRLAELYATALDGFYEVENVVGCYVFEK